MNIKLDFWLLRQDMFTFPAFYDRKETSYNSIVLDYSSNYPENNLMLS